MSSDSEEKYGVTVVIPAYNAADYIARAIDSVLAQTRSADEIIVLDDGSTDNTGQVIAGYGSKIRYIRQENAGASVARNTAIKAAHSEWIAFLDSDDEWYRQKLEVQMALLKRNPHLEWATANFDRSLCREDQRESDITQKQGEKLLMGKEYFDSYFAASISGASWCTDTMIIKRKVLEEAGLFRTGQKRANDLDMWWRIAHRRPQIGYSPQPLAVYHMGTQQSISQGFFHKELYCDLIERHLTLAAEHNRLEKFQPFAAFMLRRWMRSMLFQARREDIRAMIKRFEKLLPGSYRILMHLLTTCPRITANGCHLLSWMNRILKLRPKIVRRPKR